MKQLIFAVCFSAFSVCSTVNSNNEFTEKNPENHKRYFEEIFSEITFGTYTYGKNATQSGKVIDLKLDVYQPKNDTLNKRPLIIYVHGGGFTKNSRNTIKDLGFLQTLAKSGFVVASIDYRLIDTPQQNPMSVTIGILNAIEDTRAAIRFFRKDAATNNNFKIDVDNIVLGGYSAGAITSLFTVFLNSQIKIDTYFPMLSDYIASNGGLEGSSGNPGYSTNVSGIFNVAGGISNLDILDNSINFIYNLHGTKDDTVPFAESPQLKGSKLIHEKALNINLKSVLNAPNTDHGILYTCSDCRKDLQKYIAKQVSQ